MIREYKGKLISRIDRMGSRSEGPEYFLELDKPNDFGQIEIPIRKKASLWQKDPNLHPFIGKQVLIKGKSVIIKHVKLDDTFKLESIDYRDIEDITSQLT
jgi:hypothetical protein